MKTKLHYVLTIAMLLCVFSVLAQDDTWNKVNQIEHTQDFKALNLLESKTHLFKLDTLGFKQLVSSAPLNSLDQNFWKNNKCSWFKRYT